MKSLLSMLTVAAFLVGGLGAAETKKYSAGSCCDKAQKKGEACKHPCCVEAEKKGETCKKCNKES